MVLIVCYQQVVDDRVELTASVGGDGGVGGVGLGGLGPVRSRGGRSRR